jgi:hypothetical protein
MADETTVATRIAIPIFRVLSTLQVLAAILSGFVLEPSYGVLAQANEIIEHHADLSGDRYRSLQQARRGETIEYAALPELAFRADAMLG